MNLLKEIIRAFLSKEMIIGLILTACIAGTIVYFFPI
jgi:hypothetical protein